MKILKLGGLFLIVAAVVVGALFLIGDGLTLIDPPVQNLTLEETKKDFEKNWDAAGDWDAAIFSRHCRDVETLSAKYDVKEIKDFNVLEANDIVCRKIFEHWKKSDCKLTDIDRYVAAAKAITDYDSRMNSDDGIVKLRRVNGVYRKAHALSHKSMALTPKFNGSSWNDFKSHEEGMKKQRNDIRGNTDYKEYLSNISSIKDGLNSMDSRLSTAKREFYQKLHGQIKSHFGKTLPENRTREQLNRLKAVHGRYSKEAPTGSPSLYDFVSAYERDVTNNEAKKTS